MTAGFGDPRERGPREGGPPGAGDVDAVWGPLRRALAHGVAGHRRPAGRRPHDPTAHGDTGAVGTPDGTADAAALDAAVETAMGAFMAMGATYDAERGQLLRGYKHIATRRYLFLDSAGGAYRYDAPSGRYVAQPVDEALARAMASDMAPD